MPGSKPSRVSAIYNFRFLIALGFLILALLPVSALEKKSGQATSNVRTSSPANYRVETGSPNSSYVRQYLKPGTYLDTSQIKPGMEGYGLSVFRGTKVERFGVKVIGVMKNVINGRDAILIRLSGKAIGNNKVVRGMSGSPIYIDDKLIGALSYGFDFSMEPIAGVTPIVDMLDALEKASVPSVGSTPLKKSQLPLSPEQIAMSKMLPESGNFRTSALGASSPNMVPLVTPVALSGYSPRARKFLESRFEALGMAVSGSGSSGGLDDELSGGKVEPGSALAVMLSKGDFASVATGTVTTVFKDKVLAFGHPFLQAGAVDFPIAQAYVHEILPSLAISFKLSSPTRVVGSLFSDRPWSVGGELGAQSKMVPMSIVVRDSSRKLEKRFHTEIIDHPDLTTELVAATALSAIDATHQSASPYVATMRTKVKVRNKGVLDRVDKFGSEASSSALEKLLFGDPISGFVSGRVDKLLDNRFERVGLDGIELDITLEPGRNTSKIVRVYTDKSTVRPGETVKVSSVLEPFDGKEFIEEQTITIPRSAPDGDLVIGVAGGGSLESVRNRMGIKDPVPRDFQQLLKELQTEPRGDVLTCVLGLPQQAIHVDGRALQSPPGHWIRLFFSNRYTHGPELVDGEVQVSKNLDTLITGSHIIAIKVERESKFLARKEWYQPEPKGAGKKEGAIFITSQAQKVVDSASSKKSGGTPSSTPSASTKSKQPETLSIWGSLPEETHVRVPLDWSQSDESAYREGTKKSLTVDSWGRLFPAFELDSERRVDGELRAWSCTLSGGSFYFSTSDKVYRWNGSGASPTKIASFDSVAIPAMAAAPNGRLYVACVPGGKVFSIDSTSGANKLFTTVPESLITALETDAVGNLYIGVAGTGKVYKATPDGSRTMLCDTGQAHVTALHWSRADSRLYIGTGESGCVFSIAGAGPLKAEYQSDQHLVTGVARNKDGDLFVITAGDGQLVRVKPSGETVSLATSEAFYSLIYDSYTDSVFAGDAEGDITQIQMEPLTGQAFFVPVKHTDQEAVPSLATDNSGRLFVLTSNLPKLYAFSISPKRESVYTSPVKDAARLADWSRLRLYGAFNQESDQLEKVLTVETRSGDTVRPTDKGWSAWQVATPSKDGLTVASPDARFLQYRLRWNLAALSSASKDRVFPLGRSSVVGKVSVTYLPSNLHPVYSSVSLKSGEFISETEDLEVAASDPDGDNLSMNISISSDDGTSWKTLASDVRSENPEKSAAKTSTSSKGKKVKGSKPGSKGRPATSTVKLGDPTEKSPGGKQGTSEDKGASKSDSDKETSDGEDDDSADSSKSSDDSGDESADDSNEGSNEGSGDSERPDEKDEPDEKDPPTPIPQPGGSGVKPDREPDDGGESEREGDPVGMQGTSNTVHLHAARAGWFARPRKLTAFRLPGFVRLQSKDDDKDKHDDKDGSGSKEKDKDSGKDSGGDKDANGKKNQASGKTGKDGKKPSFTKGAFKTKAPQSAPKKKPGAVKRTEKLKYSWNTTKQKDGEYLLRFDLGDKPSNLEGATTTTFYRYVVVDNSKPILSGVSVQRDGNLLTIRADAKDSISPIANAVFQVDDDDPQALSPDGKILDSKEAHLSADKVQIKKKAKKVKIVVTDMAGNKVEKTVELR